MSFKNMMKGLLYDEDPKPKEQTPIIHKMEVIGNTVTYNNAPVAIDPAVKQKLEDLVATECPAGYKEFFTSLNTLASIIPNEQDAYKAVLKLAETKGITVATVLSDIDSCLSILQRRKTEFDNELSNQLKIKVGGLEQEIKNTEVIIKEKQTALEKIHEEINLLQQDNLNRSQKIHEDKAKLSSVEHNFAVAYRAVHNSITEQRNKVSTYGKG